MVNRIRIIYSCELNKGFGSKFFVDSQVWQETFKVGWRMHQPKHFEYNNKDEDNNSNTLNDNNFFFCFVVTIEYWVYYNNLKPHFRFKFI